ncbi:MAG: benzoyl-CoA-dihydrodiol lyase [Deltaproteobacteria bacterium]|nr:benzoyl-CoA-dihydrodiol lyase [Deltaproteobacteria bacterium]HCH65079.1 benzoyl-CoA-dihydrodiol lyase [Deltaproteobacteria bacterium]
MAEFDYPAVNFTTSPDQYKHWKVDYDGEVATVRMQIQEDKPLWDGKYDLKLNSYDLGVDIELNDLVTRMRFEHPEVRAVVVTGGYDKVFCAGANIRMLGMAPHAFKVNFCKYTNETRCMIEEATQQSGQIYIAALNGTASGGGYELALACEHIYLIDDGNAAVSLPEVPLLGVLPGTGGLTRLTDKRKVRRDVSDVFCTKAEGFRARDAKKFRLIDGSFPRSKWSAGIESEARRIAAESAARQSKSGAAVALPGVSITEADDGWSYPSVSVRVDGRIAHILLKGPEDGPSRSAGTWGLRAFRELEDALLRLRLNHLNVGVLILKTEGDIDAVLAHESWLEENCASDDFFYQEVRSYQSRVLRKVDNMAKSVFALVEEGHCFVGTLFELSLAADRTYMFMDDDGENALRLSDANFGAFPMAAGCTRLEARFPGEPELIEKARSAKGEDIEAEDAFEEYGLVTISLDDIDYEDEVRIAIEERVSLSPDALTGMEQNLRFPVVESAETKIYGRLSAWQNWIFQRPNAVGQRGALTLYGQPERPVFDFRRT